MAAQRAPQNSNDTACQDGQHSQQRVLLPQDLLRKMFEDQSGDWEMIATDGRAIKFHPLILSEQVEHFRDFFLTEKSKQCKNKVRIPKELIIGGKSVEAFVRYIYCKDCTAMDSSFSITFDLIQVGYLYGVPCLLEVANQKIQERGADAEDAFLWFNVEELWELYLHVSFWGEEDTPIKTKLLENVSKVLQRYCQCEEHQKTLMNLTKRSKASRLLLLAFMKQAMQSGSPPEDF